jgi:hypothetical protein
MLAWLTCGLLWWFPLHQTLRFGLAFILVSVLLSAPLLAVLSAARSRLFEATFFVAVVLTCGVVALEPATAIGSRALFDRWSRAEVLDYPAWVDSLPHGTTIYSLHPTKNMAMAGKRLGNRVVGDFEGRRRLTDEFLRERGIDFVVGRASRSRRLENLTIVELYLNEDLPNPITGHVGRWRIWKVNGGESE